MPKGPTPREEARARNIVRIKDLALTQLAAQGAESLSLRAIARELNIVSSAIYRYYASRDELLTALIVDAYDDLATVMEQAGATRRTARHRFVRTCLALRTWAVSQPHRFALVYGTAIPGYVAPPATVEPAGRVVAALLVYGERPPPPVGRAPARALAAQLDGVADAFGVPGGTAVDREALLGRVGVFARLVGLLTLELGGHFVGGFEPADALYAALVEREADLLDL